MTRRVFLKALLCALPYPCPALSKTSPGIPVLMFHRLAATPRYPEEVSAPQLRRLLDHLWRSGFAPITVGDILAGRIDRILPPRTMPVCLTADDAHPSIVFRSDSLPASRKRQPSFVEVLRRSLAPYGHPVRMTVFLGRMRKDQGYFGNRRRLSSIIEDTLTATPHVEFGYHTNVHRRMGSLSVNEVRTMVVMQADEFRRLGVHDLVAKILAYPYGEPPASDADDALRRLGFVGAVTASPGRGEMNGLHALCTYDGQPIRDPFRIPRINIGAFTYAASRPYSRYTPIEPLDDFLKDVGTDRTRLYMTPSGADSPEKGDMVPPPERQTVPDSLPCRSDRAPRHGIDIDLDISDLVP